MTLSSHKTFVLFIVCNDKDERFSVWSCLGLVSKVCMCDMENQPNEQGVRNCCCYYRMLYILIKLA